MKRFKCVRIKNNLIEENFPVVLFYLLQSDFSNRRKILAVSTQPKQLRKKKAWKKKKTFRLERNSIILACVCELLWLQNPFKNVIIKIESSLMSIDTLYFAV